MISVAVLGSEGRMGRTVCQAVSEAPDMELVAGLDAGDEITPEHLNGADVAVDFTVPQASEGNVHACLDAGINVVVGTTGWTDEAIERVRAHADEAGQCVLIAPNFAMSAVLVMEFAKKAARYFDSVEVLEMHHPRKLDAPSGTAHATARGIAAARKHAHMAAMPDATQTDALGTRGGVVDGVPVHAIRLAGLNAHEEVLFGNPGEQLVLRTDCFDRVSFMPGVLHAVRAVLPRRGLILGLDQVLDLD